MAEGSEAPYKPILWKGKPGPLPDKVRATDGSYFNPNAPAPKSEPMKDMRPVVLLAQLGGETAEEVGNRILTRKNGSKLVAPPKPEDAARSVRRPFGRP